MGHAFIAAKILATKIDHFMDSEIEALDETVPVDFLNEALEGAPFEYSAAMAQEFGVTSRLIGAREEFEIAGIQAKIEILVERPCGKRRRRLLVDFSAP